MRMKVMMICSIIIFALTISTYSFAATVVDDGSDPGNLVVDGVKYVIDLKEPTAITFQGGTGDSAATARGWLRLTGITNEFAVNPSIWAEIGSTDLDLIAYGGVNMSSGDLVGVTVGDLNNKPLIDKFTGDFTQWSELTIVVANDDAGKISTGGGGGGYIAPNYSAIAGEMDNPSIKGVYNQQADIMGQNDLDESEFSRFFDGNHFIDIAGVSAPDGTVKHDLTGGASAIGETNPNRISQASSIYRIKDGVYDDVLDLKLLGADAGSVSEIRFIFGGSVYTVSAGDLTDLKSGNVVNLGWNTLVAYFGDTDVGHHDLQGALGLEIDINGETFTNTMAAFENGKALFMDVGGPITYDGEGVPIPGPNAGFTWFMPEQGEGVALGMTAFAAPELPSGTLLPLMGLIGFGAFFLRKRATKKI